MEQDLPDVCEAFVPILGRDESILERSIGAPLGVENGNQKKN
jgi:hypothetical protein